MYPAFFSSPLFSFFSFIFIFTFISIFHFEYKRYALSQSTLATYYPSHSVWRSHHYVIPSFPSPFLPCLILFQVICNWSGRSGSGVLMTTPHHARTYTEDYIAVAIKDQPRILGLGRYLPSSPSPLPFLPLSSPSPLPLLPHPLLFPHISSRGTLCAWQDSTTEWTEMEKPDLGSRSSRCGIS